MRYKLIKFLNSLDDIVMKVERSILSSIMMIISFAVILQVISRYVFNSSIIGLGEVAKFGIVWITFLGTSLCTRLGSHISMTAVIEKVPPKIKKIMITVISIVSSVFTFYLAILSYRLVRSLINFGTVSPTLRFPLWILYSIAPIAFFTTSIYYFRIFIKNLRNKGVYVGLENLDEEEEIQI